MVMPGSMVSVPLPSMMAFGVVEDVKVPVLANWTDPLLRLMLVVLSECLKAYSVLLLVKLLTVMNVVEL